MIPAVPTLLLRYWPWLAVLAGYALLGAVAFGLHLQRDAARAELLHVRTVHAEDRAAAEAAARQALQAAQDAASAERVRLVAEGRAAVDRATAAEAQARAALSNYRRRLREAQATDPSCAAWSEVTIPCPVSP